MSRDGIRPDERLFPVLTDSGREMLRQLFEHPAAPIYRNRSGHRLIAEDLPLLRTFAEKVLASDITWPPCGRPEWLDTFLANVWQRVPGYRSRGTLPNSFLDIPTMSRADLSRDITRFVPDDLPLDRLIEYSTSGTTGHPLKLPSHPRVAASYLAFHRRALARFGIDLRARQGDVSVMLVGYQQRCFTYVSVNPLMEEAGLAKINLHPADWHCPGDRARYIDALAPELITGDPLSLSELAALSVSHTPRAILSTSMAMGSGLRTYLQDRFSCPVVDLYSMNECGPIAAYDPVLDGHLLLQHQLFVEILDPMGQSVPPGERGEITLTGGFNFFLPLLRYRTGDFASLEMTEAGPLLRNIVGRPPVRFQTDEGRWINNVDVSHCLAAFALPQYNLHQRTDGSLLLQVGSSALEAAPFFTTALKKLFGSSIRVDVTLLKPVDKPIQYTSDIPQAHAT